MMYLSRAWRKSFELFLSTVSSESSDWSRIVAIFTFRSPSTVTASAGDEVVVVCRIAVALSSQGSGSTQSSIVDVPS